VTSGEQSNSARLLYCDIPFKNETGNEEEEGARTARVRIRGTRHEQQQNSSSFRRYIFSQLMMALLAEICCDFKNI
jgi:hypothetical protein